MSDTPPGLQRAEFDSLFNSAVSLVCVCVAGRNRRRENCRPPLIKMQISPPSEGALAALGGGISELAIGEKKRRTSKF